MFAFVTVPICCSPTYYVLCGNNCSFSK